MKRKLITLSSPIAVRNNNVTRLINVVEGTVQHIGGSGDLTLHIYRCFNSTTQLMEDVPAPSIQVTIKASNIRSEQEVA